MSPLIVTNISHSHDHMSISVWHSPCPFVHFCTALKILTPKCHLPASLTWPRIHHQCEGSLLVMWSCLLVCNGWDLLHPACPKLRFPHICGVRSHHFLRLAVRVVTVVGAVFREVPTDSMDETNELCYWTLNTNSSSVVIALFGQGDGQGYVHLKACLLYSPTDLALCNIVYVVLKYSCKQMQQKYRCRSTCDIQFVMVDSAFLFLSH